MRVSSAAVPAVRGWRAVAPPPPRRGGCRVGFSAACEGRASCGAAALREGWPVRQAADLPPVRLPAARRGLSVGRGPREGQSVSHSAATGALPPPSDGPLVVQCPWPVSPRFLLPRSARSACGALPRGGGGLSRCASLRPRSAGEGSWGGIPATGRQAVRGEGTA